MNQKDEESPLLPNIATINTTTTTRSTSPPTPRISLPITSKNFYPRLNIRGFTLPPTPPIIPSTTNGDIRAPKSKKRKTTVKARKNVGEFRRRKRVPEVVATEVQFTTWKGRIGVHMYVEEFDLKALTEVIPHDLPHGWEVDDGYDVIRLGLPFNFGQPNISSVSSLFSQEEQESESRQGLQGMGNNHQLNGHSLTNTNEEILLSAADAMMTEEEAWMKQSALLQAGAFEVYVFSFGAVVCWNFPNVDSEKSWIERYLLRKQYFDDSITGPRNHEDAVQSANDEMDFCYGSEFHLRHDVVYLKTREQREKLAVSFALAKSANLSIFEWRLDQFISRNAHIPEELATTGRISMSKKEIGMEIGRIFLVKSGIHLENTILDTPEDFWEDDRFHGEYEQSMKYFDITSRLELVNTRLEVMQDMNQILMEAVQSHNANILEWTVILLIVFEILVEVFRMYLDY